MRIKKSCNIVRSMKNHNMHGLSSVCVYLERQFSFSALRFAVLYAAMRGGETMCASRVPRYASHSNRGRPQAEEEIMETTQPKARRETSAEFFFHFLFFSFSAYRFYFQAEMQIIRGTVRNIICIVCIYYPNRERKRVATGDGRGGGQRSRALTEEEEETKSACESADSGAGEYLRLLYIQLVVGRRPSAAAARRPVRACGAAPQEGGAC